MFFNFWSNPNFYRSNLRPTLLNDDPFCVYLSDIIIILGETSEHGWKYQLGNLDSSISNSLFQDRFQKSSCHCSKPEPKNIIKGMGRSTKDLRCCYTCLRRRNWTSSSEMRSSVSPHPPDRRWFSLRTSGSLEPLPALRSFRCFLRGESDISSQNGSGSLSRSVLLRFSLLQKKRYLMVGRSEQRVRTIFLRTTRPKISQHQTKSTFRSSDNIQAFLM